MHPREEKSQKFPIESRGTDTLLDAAISLEARYSTAIRTLELCRPIIAKAATIKWNSAGITARQILEKIDAVLPKRPGDR